MPKNQNELTRLLLAREVDTSQVLASAKWVESATFPPFAAFNPGYVPPRGVEASPTLVVSMVTNPNDQDSWRDMDMRLFKVRFMV